MVLMLKDGAPLRAVALERLGVPLTLFTLTYGFARRRTALANDAVHRMVLQSWDADRASGMVAVLLQVRLLSVEASSSRSE